MAWLGGRWRPLCAYWAGAESAVALEIAIQKMIFLYLFAEQTTY
jgi:hypothetical protein